MVIYYNIEGGTIIIPENILRINQRLDIIIETDDKKEIYHSRIEDMTATNLVLAMPMIKSRPILLFPQDIFYGKIIYKYCVYQFKSQYVDKRFSPVPVWITTLPTEFTKIQQRSFVRVSAFIDCNIEIFDKEEDMKSVEKLSAITRDISGGGAQITVNEDLSLGTLVRLSFPIPGDTIKVMCEVVRSTFQPEAKVYWLGLKYLDLSEANQRKLVRYIFQLQIEKKQRE